MWGPCYWNHVEPSKLSQFKPMPTQYSHSPHLTHMGPTWTRWLGCDPALTTQVEVAQVFILVYTFRGIALFKSVVQFQQFLVWWNRSAPQTTTGEILHGGHANMHERAQVEEHVVEGVDRQASGFISVFQRYNGRVQGVGHVAETWTACFNHFFGALRGAGRRTEKV